MSRRASLFLGGAIILGVLTACGPQSDDATKASSSPDKALPEAKDTGPSFDQEKGLFLPDDTQRDMGITTAPAQKKTFQAEQAMKFQIFREEDEAPLPGMPYRSGYAYASAILAGPKPGLEPGQMGEVLGKGDAPKALAAKLFQSNTLPVSNQIEWLVEIADPQHQFALDEFCAVNWKLAAVDAVVAVPDSALLTTTEGNYVYVQKEGRFIRTEVKLGATGGGFTEITEGAVSGDIVVTSPVQNLVAD